jgi:hypothetical protein
MSPVVVAEVAWTIVAPLVAIQMPVPADVSALLVTATVPVEPVTWMPIDPAPVAVIVSLTILFDPVMTLELPLLVEVIGVAKIPPAFAPVVVIVPRVMSVVPAVGVFATMIADGLTYRPVAPAPVVEMVPLLRHWRSSHSNRGRAHSRRSCSRLRW